MLEKRDWPIVCGQTGRFVFCVKIAATRAICQRAGIVQVTQHKLSISKISKKPIASSSKIRIISFGTSSVSVTLLDFM